MFKHRYIRIVFVLALLVLIGMDYLVDLPWYLYLILVLTFLFITFLGSYFIRLNYFTESLCHGSRAKKEIALTFDDGPLKNFTPEVLDILKVEKVPAAFFLIGKNISGNESLLERMAKEGHLIGNHSFDHGFWFSLNGNKKMIDDLKRCDEEINRVTGLSPKLFRPPYGVTNPTIAKVIQEQKFTSIGWSLRTYDTVAKSPEQLLVKTLNNLKNGDVILFHDWGKHTISILSKLICEARERGYRFVSLDKLLDVNS
ncbi:MAG: polysaccharide deacetylase family protein [Bacteroidetes bacterium]|nr:polysaccharide deacetylase family protein [Bacteroidota bacterium]